MNTESRKPPERSKPNRYDRALMFVFTRGVFIAIWAIACLISTTMIADLKRDTTGLTNGAFAILASLAALSYAAARGESGKRRSAETFNHIAERFLYAAVLLVVASILKYGYLAAAPLLAKVLGSYAATVIGSIWGIPIPVLLMFAVGPAAHALKDLNAILMSRITSRPDWDAMI